MTDMVDKLYEYYNELDAAKDQIGQHQDAYAAILAAVKGSSQEKRLAAQFIGKFFGSFPQLHEQAIDALLDLCEDDDVAIRRQAIRELPQICRDHKDNVTKMADVLAQLLQTDDQTELTIVNQSLLTLSKYDARAFLAGLFPQIVNGDDVVRDRAIKFLKDKMKPAETFTKEVEEYFLEECRKVMHDVTKDEFVIFMNLLGSLKMSKTIAGQQTLLEMIAEQAELEAAFEHSDVDFVDKLVMCIRHAVPFFSQFVPSTDFFVYLCKQVLPALDKAGLQPDVALEFLKLLAETAPFISPNPELIDVAECQLAVFENLLKHLPLPPSEMTAEVLAEEPSVNFTLVESLLFALHQLGKHDSKLLTDSTDERVKDFRLRLQYLARGVQSTINKMRKALGTVKKSDLDSDENKLRRMALKTTLNINSLIKDLFKTPPQFGKTTLILSWKSPTKALPTAAASPTYPTLTTPTATEAPKEVGDDSEQKQDNGTTTGKKRQLITAPEGTTPKSRDRQIYAPPSGKFSAGVQRFAGGGGGGRGFRGGGRGRGFSGRGGGGRPWRGNRVWRRGGMF